jgi:2-amino-4-hydroxy-6-hydroxymethyldihydropteridine diphosphokinase
MMERAFVLIPLAEIAPDLAVRGVRVSEALARLDRSGVARVRAPA